MLFQNYNQQYINLKKKKSTQEGRSFYIVEVKKYGFFSSWIKH